MAFRIIYKYLSWICCFCFDEPDDSKNEGNYADMKDDNVHVNNDFYSNNISASSLTGEAPQCFSSDVFSNLPYQDLRQAHRESIIPVTDEDYKNVKKFRNVNEIISFRGTQDTAPLSDRQAMELLTNREKKTNEEATKRAYYFAKQVEESKKKDNQFWSSMKRLN
jgi:hypothetical protein